ncbi:deoxyribodipyrimidine photo-lyase [Actimicrobium sp. GrIS 1.19]|uniref:FAD-binding domain-containing protein n=1 Tax=Actimicrobium sp. GrIS 1.19 TaxID=3071708 RepID=UPI002DFCFFCC|nr:deoxyribodipyrimidine photo-lyase [Actimicrobium sp. GrIS 1.19]
MHHRATPASMADPFAPTLAAVQARINAVDPAAYASTRNALDGAVSNLSPYITHGFVTLAEVMAGVRARHPLEMQHKFVYELGWRAYFRHVWQHRGEAILRSLHAGPLPDAAYAHTLPHDIRHGCTGVPVIDQAVRTLYATGMLHNHARMWLASYVVHVRKVHWRAGADWLYGHLLDGDIASNHLSWQWVAGTASHKPYLFNADNVARFAPAPWHSPGSVIDVSYEALDAIARQAPHRHAVPADGAAPAEPLVTTAPSAGSGVTAPDGAAVAGRDVWLVHPWSLGRLPDGLPADTLVIGIIVADFHAAWRWSERRWHFVETRMAELAATRWFGSAAAIGAALHGARTVRSIDEPHLAPWLSGWAECAAAPLLFPSITPRCDSFSKWWTRAARGLDASVGKLPP